MPKYKITDSITGESLIVSGDSAPDQQDVEAIFQQARGIQNPAMEQEANSILQRIRNYLGVQAEPKKPVPIASLKETGELSIGERLGIAQHREYPKQSPEMLERETEINRVVAQGFTGLTGGLNELIFGKVERPQTTIGTITGTGAELGGFILGPLKGAKFLLGSRLAPTATGLKGMAQILIEGGAQLGIASGLSRIIPSFLESKDFGDMALDISENTGLGTLTGIIYPVMGVVPTKPLRMAATLAVMDKIRAGIDQWFTLDDFVTGLRDGTIDKKELAQMTFSYLMDLYFALKTPSIRTQLKALEGIGTKIRELNPDEVGQTILDLSREPEINARIQELKLIPAVQYEEKIYSGKVGEDYNKLINRNGLMAWDKIGFGYLDRDNNFHLRKEILDPIKTGEEIHGQKVRESLPKIVSEKVEFYKPTPEDFILMRSKSNRPQFLTPYTAEQLKGFELYMNKGGIGYALTPEKDLVNVFNVSGQKGAGIDAVIDAIGRGAKTLDCYDGYLKKYYEEFGFKEYKSDPWNDLYTPENWNLKTYGKPDIIYMKYEGGRDVAELRRIKESLTGERIIGESSAITKAPEVVTRIGTGEGLRVSQEKPSTPIGPMGAYPERSALESPLETTLKYGPEKEMAQSATESMIEKGIKRDRSKLMTEQLIEEWLSDPSRYQEITAKYGMTPQEFAAAMKEQASSWGRKLGEIGLEAQRLGMEIPEIGKALAELERINRNSGVWDSIQSHYKSFDRIRRGLLVTQLSTSVRNFETQLGRVGLDVFEKALDSGLQKLLGKTQTVSPLEGVEQLFKIFQRGESRQVTETILKEFPKEYNRMYSNYMSDIETGTIGSTLNRGVDILNTANRFQEFLFRNGVFRASLEQHLRGQGKDLIQIIEKNLGEIPKESIEYAVDRALEMTFAQSPKYGTIGQKFVSFINSMPGATFIIPFPRFLLNSTKFIFEYNPTGMLKLLDAKERAAFAKGDTHVMSRAIIGTTMLGVAYLLRDSDYAGEKWYELNAGGKTIDLRPFNPFAAYLFIADVVHKSIHGNLQSLTSKDIVMGVLSTNLRAGTGLYALDQILNALSKTGDSEKAIDLLKQFAGELTGGFLTPLNQIKEFLAGFDDYVVREKRSDPFWGPIKEKLPWLEKTLPELYTPTKEGPAKRELPALRQATGLMIRTKNDLEKELDRLGFAYQDIVHSTGNAEADNLINQYMGIMAEGVALPLVQSEAYKNLPDEQRAYYLGEVLKEMRETGRGVAEAKDPYLFMELQVKKIPKRERAFLESIGIDFGKIIDQYRQMRKGE